MLPDERNGRDNETGLPKDDSPQDSQVDESDRHARYPSVLELQAHKSEQVVFSSYGISYSLLVDVHPGETNYPVLLLLLSSFYLPSYLFL